MFFLLTINSGIGNHVGVFSAILKGHCHLATLMSETMKPEFQVAWASSSLAPAPTSTEQRNDADNDQHAIKTSLFINYTINAPCREISLPAGLSGTITHTCGCMDES